MDAARRLGVAVVDRQVSLPVDRQGAVVRRQDGSVGDPPVDLLVAAARRQDARVGGPPVAPLVAAEHQQDAPVGDPPVSPLDAAERQRGARVDDPQVFPPVDPLGAAVRQQDAAVGGPPGARPGAVVHRLVVLVDGPPVEVRRRDARVRLRAFPPVAAVRRLVVLVGDLQVAPPVAPVACHQETRSLVEPLGIAAPAAYPLQTRLAPLPVQAGAVWMLLVSPRKMLKNLAEESYRRRLSSFFVLSSKSPLYTPWQRLTARCADKKLAQNAPGARQWRRKAPRAVAGCQHSSLACQFWCV